MTKEEALSAFQGADAMNYSAAESVGFSAGWEAGLREAERLVEERSRDAFDEMNCRALGDENCRAWELAMIELEHAVRDIREAYHDKNEYVTDGHGSFWAKVCGCGGEITVCRVGQAQCNTCGAKQ